MGIIAWILLGLLAGMIARMLVPGKDPQGLIITTLIGIAGALVGGFVAAELFDVDGTQGFFNISTWITAIAGSAALLLAYHLVTGQGSGPRNGRGRGSGRSRGSGRGRGAGRWAGRR